MALDRKYQKIFGKNAEVTDLGIVGSKNAGNPDTSNDVEELQSLSNWETGLRAQVTASEAPYLQDQNSIFYVITSQLAYLFQAGIAEWNAQTEYFSGRSVVLKDGKTYIAIANSVGIEPEVTSGWGGYWKSLTTDWGRISGDINDQVDLVSLIGRGYYAICESNKDSLSKDIVLDNLVLDGNNNIPAGTKITVSFWKGSNCHLYDHTGGVSTYTTLNIYSSGGTLIKSARIRIASGNDEPNIAMLFVKSRDIVTFTIDTYGNAVAENKIIEEKYYYNVSPYKWYKLWMNGWSEQGGRTDTRDGNGQVSVTVAFPSSLYEMYDTNYTFTLSCGIGQNSGQTNDVITSINTFGFVIQAGSPSSYSWTIQGFFKIR